jgi:hypothetical protein
MMGIGLHFQMEECEYVACFLFCFPVEPDDDCHFTKICSEHIVKIFDQYT